MRKLLSLTASLLLAAISVASVKTVTIPAIPDGKKDCSFVVDTILVDSTIQKNWASPLQELVGQTFFNDTTIEMIQNVEGANDTLKCAISTGKRPSIITRDSVFCSNILNHIDISSLVQINQSTFWEMSWLKPEYIERESQYNTNINTYKYSTNNASQELIENDPDLDKGLTINPIHDTVRFSIELYPEIYDTITGCKATGIISLSRINCGNPVNWINYDGPKEYNDYSSDDYLMYLEDSIFALDPLADCICPLPMDTIVESTQSDDSSACEHYKYDVTVKLVAKMFDTISDTIVAYVLHLDDSGSKPDLYIGDVIADFAGNCTFTVPELALPLLRDCRCGSTYYTTNVNLGDTITKSTDMIYTIKNFCTGVSYDTVHIIVPEKDELVQIFGGDTTIYAKDSVALGSVVEIKGAKITYDWNTNACIYVPNANIILNVYKDSISESNLVTIDPSIRYSFDDVNMSGRYFYLAKDTSTGCSASLDAYITVLPSDSSAAPNITADIYEQEGDIYTASGAIVMKNVYFKDVMDRLKEGLYIFNNKKIFVRRR